MAGPAPFQPGLCPINPDTGQRECPPTTEKDCIIVEKVFDQCVKEEIITRRITIPTKSNEPCKDVDTKKTTRIECKVNHVDCNVANVSPPIPNTNNQRIITVCQDVEITISLYDGNTLQCSFTHTINDVCQDIVMYVPPQGLLFGASGGPFVFCEVVGAVCYCRLETVPPCEKPDEVICTIKICKVVEVTAFIKLLIPTYGFCVPPPCEAAPQEIEIECPPLENLFPPQEEVEDP